MPTTVGQHSVAAFTSPVNGTTPIDANTVRGNDNTTRVAYVNHDSDPGIHVQSSTLASRPTAGTAGRKWITADAGSYKLWFDDGTRWHEIGNDAIDLAVVAGENLVKGDVVSVTGFNNGLNLPIVAKYTGSAPAFGIVAEAIANGAQGYIINTGLINDVNTQALGATGTVLYPAATGTFTATKPVSGTYQVVAYVLRQNSNNGALYVEFSAPRIVERSDNTVSTIVLRDSNGDFSAGTINATAINTTTLDLTNLEVTNIKAKDGTASIAIADSTGVATITAAPILSALTASQAVFTNASKALVSNAITGTGNVVMSASPTLTGTANVANLTASGTITGALTGNADTATKLSSARTFAVTGDVTGSVSSDLTSGASIATSIAAGVIVNADINASAAIDFSKLASLPSANLLVGSSGNVPTARAITGDVTISNTGVTAIASGVIVDADISATAEIAVSKLADGAARQLLQTDAAGTGVEWTSNVDVPGTLDVTGATTLDSTLTVVGAVTEGGSGVVVQTDLGSAPNEIPLNQYLGTMAFRDELFYPVTAGTGITAGVGTVYGGAVSLQGGMKRVDIVIDLTGLNSGGTAGDIIGVNGTALPCHIGQLPSFVPLGGRMTCLEVPAGSDDDLDLYSATEGTGVEDQAVTALTETQLVDAGGAWTLGLTKVFSADPTSAAFLYLVGQETGNATYTAGRFLIEVYGV